MTLKSSTDTLPASDNVVAMVRRLGKMARSAARLIRDSDIDDFEESRGFIQDTRALQLSIEEALCDRQFRKVLDTERLELRAEIRALKWKVEELKATAETLHSCFQEARNMLDTFYSYDSWHPERRILEKKAEEAYNSL